MNKELNTAINSLLPRADERQTNYNIMKSYVKVGPLFELLYKKENQIIFGRRGSGKTHALQYLELELREKEEIPIYIDLRTIGSNNGIYDEKQYSLPQRATHLIQDLLNFINDMLMSQILDIIKEEDLDSFITAYENLKKACSEVFIVGNITKESQKNNITNDSTNRKKEFEVSTKKIGLNLSKGNKDESSKTENEKIRIDGLSNYRLSFTNIYKAFKLICSFFPNKSIWLLIDEWVSIPIEIQPFLADLLRRTFFPNNNIKVKIATIEQSSKFYIPLNNLSYIGIEIGEDINSNIVLDEYIIFENDKEFAKRFFMEFLYKHLVYSKYSYILKTKDIHDEQQLISKTFSSEEAFCEFVEACEGNPRDAIFIISKAALRAYRNKINTEHIRHSAREYWVNEKGRILKLKPEVNNFLKWILKIVLKERRSRAFLLPSDINNNIINYLYAHKLIHILSRGIIDIENPYKRYDLYSIDYGCYLDLKDTKYYPKGLFQVQDETGIKYINQLIDKTFHNINKAVICLNDYNPREIL